MVRKFNFRLERLLSYRRSLTRKEREGLAREVGALNEAEMEATQLRGYRNQMSIEKEQIIEHGTTSKVVLNLQEHRMRVEEAIVDAEKKIDEAKKDVEKQRQILVEKRRDERAIEMYKDRRWKAWLKDYYRDENRTLDDLGTIRHTRIEEG